jgi:hypothetical protein
MGQLAVRIALPSNDDDARAIFSEDNSDARLLSRPGEAIYNPLAGSIEGNNRFQVALLDDAELQSYLRAIASRHQRSTGPVVFEGNEPASLQHSAPVAEIVEGRRWASHANGRAWLGEPIAILPPVACAFDPKPGRHLLIVDRDERQGIGVLHAAWLSLLCQHRPTEARFYVLDLATSGQPWTNMSEVYRAKFDHQIEMLSRRTLAALITDLVQVATTFDASTQRAAQPTYILVQGLHRAKDLRAPDWHTGGSADISLPDQFATLLREGPEANIHVVAWCDTAANARRAVDRYLSEFGLRVVGPMSSEDSHTLLDSAEAARLDRPHRLLFYDEERPGVIQKFRPYCLPDPEWVEAISSQQRHWTT